MSRVVHKYPVSLGQTLLSLPRGAELLHVDAQAGVPQTWWLVDTALPYEPRTFVVLGTGHPLPDEGPVLAHRGTFQLDGGAFVGHLFEAVT